MAEAIYEQYKDALRRGHVAALRGDLEGALEAYGEAASVAPDRPLPHASRGAVFARQGRLDDALAAFDAALERAPRDEAATAGRAEVLATLGRRTEAAAAFDRVAATHERAGRLPDALDAARRALELAESRGRRLFVRDLSDRLGASPLDEPARRALERALRVLEEQPTAPHPASREGAAAPEGVPEGSEGAASGPAEAVVESEIAPEPEAAPEPEPPDVEALTREAEVVLESGDAAAARDRLIELAAVHRAAGRLDAALDALYLALSVAPDDADLHLDLVGLYLQRGWRQPALDKLVLLRRLAELEGDGATGDRIAAIVAEQLPDEPRLGVG